MQTRAIICCLATVSALNAQSALTGVLRSSAGVPVAGATVVATTLITAEKPSVERTTSAADGSFRLTVSRRGDWVICVYSASHLDPCQWGKPIIVNSAGAVNIGPVVLETGVRFTVAVSDPAGKVEQAETIVSRLRNVRSPVFLATVVGPDRAQRVLDFTGMTGRTRYYSTLLPVDTDFRLRIGSSLFRLRDAAKTAVPDAGREILIRPTRPVQRSPREQIFRSPFSRNEAGANSLFFEITDTKEALK